MHCLPAFHDTETTLGKQIAETYGIFRRPRGDRRGLRVGVERRLRAGPRTGMHTIKAILVATLGIEPC